MNFSDCFNKSDAILMEGGIGERLKREYAINPDKNVALASHIYDEASREALKEIFSQYIKVAENYDLPLMLTTPTRRVNKTNVDLSDFDDEMLLLHQQYPLKIFGGCCGTNAAHLEAIAKRLR